MVKNFDTNNTRIGIVFSIAIVMLGLSAAVRGTWVERVGPRKSMFTAACFWSSGFLVGAVGIATQQLWLLYLGYGVIGGIGLGIGYISPVSTLIKWFPDRPGLATGLAIMGFGGGALIATPLSQQLMSWYDPNYPPGPGDLGGERGRGGEAVRHPRHHLLHRDDVRRLQHQGSGRRLGAGRLGPVDAQDQVAGHDQQRLGRERDQDPQFYFLWVVLFCNVAAGIGILEQASPMIQDFFRNGAGVSTVTVAEAGGFVGILSLANMAGRFIWSSTSDVIGRKPIYMLYLGGGIVAYLLLATVGNNATVLFVLLAMLILSFYGGGFATVPAYLKDLFGGFQVGAIHGRLLTAWSAAGVVGPLIVNGFLDCQGHAGEADRGRLSAGALHADRPSRHRLHRQPADPTGRVPLLGAGRR